MAKLFTIFWRFFLLGWTSFGGPAAHIGYFRNTFVEKRQWLTDVEYAQLIALSQFLPGPGSSQIGFALGYRKAGLPGGIAAFAGFTLPSFAILLAVAMSSQLFLTADWYQGMIAGLKLLAVVVVADATVQMFRSFCKSQLTISLCIFSAALLLVFPGILIQMAILIAAALIGYRWLQGKDESQVRCRFVFWPLILFTVLLFGLPLLADYSPLAAVVSDFYQAGSMVFGGGHVVLPLLQSTTAGMISTDTFLTGYAAAQAVPGPMFTLATYLGYFASGSTPVLGAIAATLAIFLPGFLLVIGVLPAWQALAARARIAGAIAGINAAVAGLLLSALYSPVFTSAVHSAMAMALVLIGCFLLRALKISVFWLVVLFIGVGVLAL
ncbi:chromate efflux transporter [Endozoicomonas sp. GU-1]|uniref:chromate efflux transporter n=1 Tax=Endozoicomonas sp. GU-1 TaxID=3009078 RepID=UPI0022B4E52C|nr:chromate efflux transporter [Endozoicomonas sp. GU-1]WBA80965.1 chromate efflux transporter [Endozoicomonas sp. GU-1]WBA88533.1 chromate efflux transporter [Endozoicomonas sp. GU-1]